MKAILRLLSIVTVLTGTALATALPSVSVMPSFTQRTTYGKAAMNESITVWGRAWNLSGATTYVINFGDGTANATGSVTTASGDATRSDFISVSHTFTTAGSKTITLSVTDSAGTTSQQGVVRVLPSPTHYDRVDMAKEKGLLYLYGSVIRGSATDWYWKSSGDEYGEGITAFSVLAFEENGHSPFNDPVQDVFVYLLQRAHTHMLSVGSLQSISNHSDGIATRSSDSNGNGKGAIFLGRTYSDCARAMALMNPFTSAAQAQTTYIPSGSPFYNATGVYDTGHPYSYYDLITDFTDTLLWSQGDGSLRGSFVYVLTNPNQSADNRYDGSAQQWPALTMIMASDVLGITLPSWWGANSVYGMEYLQNPTTGGVAYSVFHDGSNEADIGKTGGGLTMLKAGGMNATSSDGVNLLKYIQNNWESTGGDRAGWTGYWYGMYGVKKGLALQGVTTLTIGGVQRDWYLEMSAWLLGNASLLPDTMSPDNRDSSDLFGQNSNGSWTSQGIWIVSPDADTAVSILSLTTAVTSPPPVPVIATIPTQSTTGPFSVVLDATGSYSTDPSREIVEYLWDFDSSDGLNWVTPDATGTKPTISPAYLHSVGTHTVTLRVKDNSNPAQYATTTAVITVSAGDVPPVAVPVASNAFQGYNGQPGASITLDGSGSYDINGDAITLYEWDLNGDGNFSGAGDATGVSVVFSQAQAYTGQIGLRVTANGVTSAPVYVDVQVALTNLSLGTVVASNVTAGTSADFAIPVTNDAASGLAFTNVLIRLYNGDPLNGGVPIGDASASTTFNIAVGQTKTVSMTNVQLGGASTIYAFADPLNTIPEANKTDNIAFCLGLQPQTITFGTLATQIPGASDFALTGTASSGLPVSYTSSNTAVATLSVSGGVTTVHIVSTGTTNITASQGGNGTYQAAANVVQLLMVSRLTQTITFPALPVTSTSSPDFDPGATSTDLSATPTYTSASPSIATIVGGKIHPIAVGTSVITVTFPADATYLSNTAQQTLTVVANMLQSVTVPENNNYRTGDTLTFTANYLFAVTVSGTPYMSIKIGSTMRQASYTGGSGTTHPTFVYTVLANELDMDGIDLYSPINLNGGGITNTAAGGMAPLAFTSPDTTKITVGGGVFMTSQVTTAPGNSSGTVIDYWDSVRSGMVISSAGSLAFRAHLTYDVPSGVNANNYQGIWKSPLGTSTSLVNVCRSSDVAPDCNGSLFDILPDNPYINNLGQITFLSFLRVGTGSPAAITSTAPGVWSELGGGGLHKVVRAGDAVAGGTASTTAIDGWIVTSDIGTMAFAVGLTDGTSALVTGSSSGGAFALSTIAKQGAAAPAVGGGTSGVFDTLLGNASDPRMNRTDGNLAFFAYLQSGASGIWYMPNSGALVAAVRSGQTIPAGGDTFASLDRPSLTSDTMFFRANLGSGPQSVWKNATPAVASGLTLIAKGGDTNGSGRVAGIPAGSQLWSIWAPFSNHNAKVTFRVSLLDGSSVETRAIVADTDGTLKIVAKVGDAAPGTAGTFTNFNHPVIGDGNQIAFVASTTDGVTAIWRQAASGGALSRLFAVGDVLSISGTSETIATLIVPGSDSSDRLSEWTTIDATGRTLVHVTYLSGKTGVLLSTP